MTLSGTWGSIYPSPYNLGIAQRMEILSLSPSVYRCLVLLLESPGPRECDSPTPSRHSFRFYDSVCFEFSTPPHNLSPTDLFTFLHLCHGL